MMFKKASAAWPTPIYELAEPNSTYKYDTGVKLFNTEKSFTILCEATFANRSWSANQKIFYAGGTFEFGVGKQNNGYAVADNVAASSSSSPYTVLTMNYTNGTTNADMRMGALYSRFADSNAQTKRFAIRYDHVLRRVEGDSEVLQAPSARWWTFENGPIPTSNSTIKFKSNSSMNSTVNIFKIYDSVLTDAQVNSFLNYDVN